MSKETQKAAKPRTTESASQMSLASHHGIGPDPEDLDPTPVEIPTGQGMPPTMAEQIAQAVHAQLEAREGVQFETPEEADDFEEEDPEILELSPYESYFQDVYIEEMTPSIQEPDPPPEPDQADVESAESAA